MREKIFIYFMHTHVLFILSLVLLRFTATTADFLGQQLAATGGRDANKCIDMERQALLDFKAQLQDPGDLLSTWGPEDKEDCCLWNGVTCNNQGHVTQLQINRRGLRGEISILLLNLTYLNYLDLSDNSLHGTIPMSIGNMTRLTFLSLMGNSFSGAIPRSIGSLTKLTNLYLSNNSFNGAIPPEFGNLTNLEYLSLTSLGSCTSENLDWLHHLSLLKELELDGISLAKSNYWVDAIIGLQNLQVLSLQGCDLSQVKHPYSSIVNSSSSIVNLSLDNNNLNSSMYHWLCTLIGNGLTSLTLSGNTFDGKLSDFLSNLSGCASNSTLYTLDASSSHLTGSVSHDIQKFSSLIYLNLSSNQLNGSISDKLWELPWLQSLDLSSNSLRGAISENIGKSNLQYIDLSINSLEGVPFNADMSNLSKNLEYMLFSSCKLGPQFPKWILNLKNLTYLDLSNNSISDTIPSEYWLEWPSQLFYLDISFNNISGTLPALLSELNFYSMDLSFNSFYGPIPALPAHISFLDMSRNKFNGGISFLCQIYDNFEFLDLSHNSITGILPDCLQNLTYLEVLNLGHNTLSGRIPPSVGRLGQLETLSLYNNTFSGELPMSLQNCTMLSFLDLGANNFLGNVPVWIGEKLSRLYVLSLRSNYFFGTIPKTICQLRSIQIIDFSKNNLNGIIPSCVNNFTTMAQQGFFVKRNVHHVQWPFYPSIVVYEDSKGFDYSYIDHLLIEWQGKVNEFSSTLGLVKTIDLSSNNLTGQIPNEITDLHELLVLDLSNNALVGEIPQDIGQMKKLLTLNLSRNLFSGEMPSSMYEMHSLNDLDVSYNNLSGRVPSSTQLQSFEPERFTGNAELCGLPTPKKCPGDEELTIPPVSESEGDGESTSESWRWFYIGGATGFATAFWIACSALLFVRRLRHAFFNFHDCLKDWVYVKVAVFIAKLQRVARA